MTFKAWLRKQKVPKESPENDFIGDVLRDRDFRTFKTWDEFERYLSFKRACPEAIEQGEIFYRRWLKTSPFVGF